jgi:hypothetical protein
MNDEITLTLNFKDRIVILSALELAKKRSGDPELQTEYAAMLDRLFPLFERVEVEV